MKMIVDANIVLAVTLFEPERENIIKATQGSEFLAPEVLPFEIGNALSAMFKRKMFSSEEMLTLWDEIQKIPVDLRNVNIRQALRIAFQYNICAYDAYFLECALSLRCPLLTLDRRMINVAQKIGVRIKEI